jgi:C-terminal processing protease CtpA/Prc
MISKHVIRRMLSISVSALSVAGLLSACSGDKNAENSLSEAGRMHLQGLRPLTSDEQKADFDQMLTMFKTYYGPYQYKEKRLGISIESLSNDLKAKALNSKTDEEFAGYVMQMGAALHDGHVQIHIINTNSGISSYKMPIVVTPLEGKAIIGDISKEFEAETGLKVGDEILSVDGQNPFDIMKTALKYRSNATPLADLHNIMYTFMRPSYMTDLMPTSSVATVKGMKADGTLVSMELPWETVKYVSGMDKIMPMRKALLDLTVPMAQDFNAIMPAHRLQMGQVNPIFITPQTQEAYQFLPLTSSETFRAKYELTEKENPKIYSSLYRHEGKNILLVRIASYSQDDFKNSVYIKAYQALLDQYQNMADVLVLDQTHNPGGSYCAEFYNIFAQANDMQSVERVHADRKWVNDFELTWPAEMLKDDPKINPTEIAGSLAYGKIVEKAYDNGEFQTEPIPLFTNSKHAILKKFQWKKPMLVLIDSLAGSCGDLFPMLVKANPRPNMKLFGENTMGLGGNVEDVGTLVNSRIQINMTRGLFTAFRENGDYQPADFVENNGVAPDYPYSVTIKDFRGGFVDYVKLFSDKAVELAK